MNKKIRVLIVDDSALVRQILSYGLSMDPGIEVIGTATDPYSARDCIIKQRPDVMTLDVEMPRMNGLEFLRKLMPQYPIPVVMVSSLTQSGKQITLDCLEAGAVDFVAKPTSNKAHNLDMMLAELRTKLKIAATTNVAYLKSLRNTDPDLGSSPTPAPLSESTDKVIAIGASTGGTEAIKKVIIPFPANMPGIVIVQHMPPVFTKMFADRLNQLCAMNVKEAETGDRITTGQILIAPGGRHMKVKRSGGFYQVNCEDGELVSGHRPSVDLLMHSVAEVVGANAIGIMLTGMGADGANGLLAMRKAGARTLAQDEASSVVFGMPKIAFERGGAERLLPLNDIAPETLRLLSEKSV